MMGEKIEIEAMVHPRDGSVTFLGQAGLWLDEIEFSSQTDRIARGRYRITLETVEELRPCPFCGGMAEVYDWYAVECSSCFAKGESFGCKESACDAWNQRCGQ